MRHSQPLRQDKDINRQGRHGKGSCRQCSCVPSPKRRKLSRTFGPNSLPNSPLGLAVSSLDWAIDPLLDKHLCLPNPLLVHAVSHSVHAETSAREQLMMEQLTRINLTYEAEGWVTRSRPIPDIACNFSEASRRLS